MPVQASRKLHCCHLEPAQVPIFQKERAATLLSASESAGAEIDRGNEKMGLIQLFKEAPVIPNITQLHHVKMANQTPVTLFLTRLTSEEWGGIGG